MLTVLPAINLQPDYPQVIKDVQQSAVHHESFWASAYTLGEPSLHASVQCTLDTHGDLLMIPANGLHLYKTRDQPSSFKLSFPALDIPLTDISLPTLQLSSTRSSFPKALQAFDLSSTHPLVVLGGSDGALTVLNYSTQTEHPLVLKGCIGDILSTRFFPSGEVVLTATLSGTIYIHSALRSSSAPPAPVRTLLAHTRPVTCTAFIDLGRQILSGSKDGLLLRWDVGRALVLGRLDTQSEVGAVDLVEETGWVGLANGSTRAFILDGEALAFTDRRLEGRKGDPIIALAIARSNPSRVLTGSSKGFVTLYDTEHASTPLATFRRSEGSITSLAWLPTGAFAVGSSDGMPFVCAEQQTEDGSAWVVQRELVGFEEAVGVRVDKDGSVWVGGTEGVRKYE